MEKERIMVFDMILQIINGNQISAEEEAEILRILEEKGRKREEKRLSRCLAGVIEQELQMKVESGEICESTKKRYMPLVRRCFIESEFGNLDASQITSEIAVDEFILEIYDSGTLNKDETRQFLSLLRLGLKRMLAKGILGFDLEEGMFRYHINAPHDDIRYTRNPYSVQETMKIMEWINQNKNDPRPLAVKLFFTAGITPSQIINLKVEDFIDDKRLNDTNKEFVHSVQKEEIIKTAINLHPKEGQYVFMFKKDGIWRKLNSKSLQIKLYYICQDIGITYRAFHKNEAIVLGR